MVKMLHILIVNSKGGSGKTTISTNIASYFENQGHKTGLMDYDPQGSSLHWLKSRAKNLSLERTIHGANAAKAKIGKLRSWEMNVPHDIEKLIIDAPAGASGILLQEMCAKADVIIIPVAPSSIDVHATADFIKDLMLIGKVRRQTTRIAVVANRVRSNAPLYKPLEKFLSGLKIPLVTKISDSAHYITAAEQGRGIFDMEKELVKSELKEFQALIDWIEAGFKDQSGRFRSSLHKKTYSNRNQFHDSKFKPKSTKKNWLSFIKSTT
jgi:chromosome partitioning protein